MDACAGGPPPEDGETDATGRGWASLAAQALDAVPSRVAVVDRSGRLVAVNRAWPTFAHVHGASDGQACEGSNFFRVCDGQDDPQHALATRVSAPASGRCSTPFPMPSG